MGSMKSCDFLGILFRILVGSCVIFVVIWPVNGLRPLRQRPRSWGDEVSGFVFCNFYFFIFFSWLFMHCYCEIDLF